MNPKILPITGTFINEITFDIPSQNWGLDDWCADFDAMQSIGIDTVIIIKGGLRNQTIFPSKVIKTKPQIDLAKFFLEETTKRNMHLYFGNYDSWDWAASGKWKEEIEINKKFMNEIWDRYGEYPSFTGWYLTHETSHRRFHFCEIRVLQNMNKCHSERFRLSGRAKNLIPLTYCKTDSFVVIDSSSSR